MRLLKSRKGISPILATLLLIVIAVAAISVTYAWIISYMGDQAGTEGVVLYEANVNFAAGNRIAIDIGNSGTSAASIVSVYIGASLTAMESYMPKPSSLTIAPGDIAAFNVTYTPGWTAGQTIYFKIVPSSGQSLSFSQKL